MRKSRNWEPNTTFHITARGNRKEDLFRERQDHLKYLSYLKETQEKHPFQLHAYCLMSNHIHLLIETDNSPLQSIIRVLHTRYAIYFNKKYDLVGHVFQGRYGSTKIDLPSYFIKASRYIHMNPVEARITTRPEDYEWSSYKSYVKNIDHPLLSKSRTLSYFSEPPEHHYKEYVETSKRKKGTTKGPSL